MCRRIWGACCIFIERFESAARAVSCSTKGAHILDRSTTRASAGACEENQNSKSQESPFHKQCDIPDAFDA